MAEMCSHIVVENLWIFWNGKSVLSYQVSKLIKKIASDGFF